jgi:hypothetical protein
MTASFQVSSNAKDVIKRFGDIARRADEYALRGAVNVAGKHAKNEVYKLMPSVFDRPTPYTLRSLYFDPLTKTNSQAVVGFKSETSGGGPPAHKYLNPHVYGGGRGAKRFEKALQAYGILPEGWYAVPGAGAPIDAFGNVPGRFIVTLLSQLRIQLFSGYDSMLGGSTNDPAKRRKSLARQGFRLFAIPPGVGGKLHPGIYAADLFGPNISCVFKFVQRPTYNVVFKFYDFAQTKFNERFRTEYPKRLADLIERFGSNPR